MPETNAAPGVLIEERRSSFSVPFLGVSVVLWAGLLYLFNLWPGHAREMASRLLELGIVDCFARQGWAAGLVCQSLGYPAGYHVAFGLPLLALKAAVAAATGLSAQASDTVVDAACLAAGVAGAIALLRQLGINRWLALFGAYLYMTSPVIYAQDGYGALRIAFVLVPTYVWIDQRLRQVLAGPPRPWPVVAGWTVLAIVAKVVALFMDGYSFVMATLLSGTLLLPWLWETYRTRRLAAAVAGVSAFAVGAAAAYVAYTAYFPGGGSFDVMPIEFFRGQGTDLYALVVPSFYFAVPLALGWTQHVTPWQAYTDFAPLVHTYIGISFIVTATLFAIWGLRRSRPRPGGAVVAVCAVGLAAFLLALGPSLKIADFREPGTFDMRNPAANYMMPAEAATLDLGTAWIYQHVPGVKVMRALYRWHLLVRLALVVALGAWATARLGARRGRLAVAVLCAAVAVEQFPNLPLVSASGVRAAGMLEGFEHDVAEPLEHTLIAGERVLVQPCLLTTARNDWMANYICGRTGVRCYNAGGDKSLFAAMRSWPAEMQAIAGNAPDTVRHIETLFDHDALDAVVFTPFGLWEQAYSWPPSEATATEGLAACQTMLGAEAAGMAGNSVLVRRAADVHRILDPPAAEPPSVQ